MQKTRKFSKSTLAVLALSIVLAVSLIVGATFAWYKATNTTGNSTVTMATFALAIQSDADHTGNSTQLLNANITNAVPNQLITLNPIDINVATNVETLVRVKITNDEEGLLALAFNDADWVKPAGSIWYYFAPTIGETQQFYAPNTGVDETINISARLDYTLETGSAVGGVGDVVTFSLTVEACQAGWTATDATTVGLPTSTADMAAAFEACGFAADANA